VHETTFAELQLGLSSF